MGTRQLDYARNRSHSAYHATSRITSREVILSRYRGSRDLAQYRQLPIQVTAGEPARCPRTRPSPGVVGGSPGLAARDSTLTRPPREVELPRR